MHEDPDLALSLELLSPFQDQPVPRARRIAGLYAALYLEDPLLHGWGGLAALVARHVHLALEAAEGLYQPFLARGNLDIYQATMPAFLRFRRGEPVTGPLRHGFSLLRRVDSLAGRDLPAAQALADRALAHLTEVEQRQVVDPAWQSLGGLSARLLAPWLRFRLGWDSASPVIDFDGRDGRDAEARCRWARDEVLPAWREASRAQPERLRADLERVRRWAGVRQEHLPARA